MNLRFVCALLAILCIRVEGGGGKPDIQKILDLSQCPIQVEPVGCFQDNGGDRALPQEIINSRDSGSKVWEDPGMNIWKNFPAFLSNFICECAKKVVAENRGDYIGIQFYAECWSGLENTGNGEQLKYDKHGTSEKCISSAFTAYPKYLAENNDKKRPCDGFCGEQLTNYVYKVTKYAEKTCPEYFTAIGCYKDNQKDPRPLHDYIMNERDVYTKNWNGRIIEWNNWDNYMPKLICRCAIAARAGGYKFFGIQFYGECWATNEESEISKDGEAPKGHCLRKLGMDPYGEHCPTKEEDEKNAGCLPSLCVGIQMTNRVYKLAQGPLGCLTDPCKQDEVCRSKGADKYECTKVDNKRSN